MDEKPLFANAYDGKAVYWLEPVDGAPAKVVRHEVSEGFRAPKSPADHLGIAAGIRTSLDEKKRDLVSMCKKGDVLPSLPSAIGGG